jgi:hypothetical protein
MRGIRRRMAYKLRHYTEEVGRPVRHEGSRGFVTDDASAIGLTYEPLSPTQYY